MKLFTFHHIGNYPTLDIPYRILVQCIIPNLRFPWIDKFLRLMRVPICAPTQISVSVFPHYANWNGNHEYILRTSNILLNYNIFENQGNTRPLEECSPKVKADISSRFFIAGRQNPPITTMQAPFSCATPEIGDDPRPIDRIYRYVSTYWDAETAQFVYDSSLHGVDGYLDGCANAHILSYENLKMLKSLVTHCCRMNIFPRTTH